MLDEITLKASFDLENRALIINVDVAQMVEQRIFNPRVVGSIPIIRTKDANSKLTTKSTFVEEIALLNSV